MQLEIGSVVDRYRLESVIGRGGMGQVFRAFDPRLRRPVALKILHERLSAEAMSRLVREARLAASLSHPNIVAVYDVGEHEGIPFMAMELIAGQQLRHLVGMPISIQEKTSWLLDLARGLEAAHRAGLVHRDVKPQNVMVTSSGAKILDFGVAKELEAGRNATALLPSLRTQPGFSMGTPQFMAPEVLRGEQESNAKTDQFSWGLLAYQLLVGQQAQRPDLEEGVRWTPPRIDTTGIDARIAAVVARTLLDDHEARFGSMGEVASALEACVAPLPRTVAQGARSSSPMRAAISMPVATKKLPVETEKEPIPSPRFAPTRLFPVRTAEPEVETAAKADARASEAPPPLAIREPTRAVLQPLADAAVAELGHAVPVGFRKAVLIVTLDVEKSKARFFVQLVATDETGELWAADASMELVRAAATMIGDDARDGNGRWQRLVLRLQRNSREAVVADVQ
jgi:serine/threonine protein kinase